MISLGKYIQEKPNFKDFLNQARQYEDLLSEINKKDSTGSDALYWALDYQLDEIAMWLVENGANANFDAAYAAAQRGNFEVLKAVVEKGAPFDDYFDVGGFTPLCAACGEASKYYRANLKVHKTVNGKKVLVTDPEEIEKIAGKDRYTAYPKIVAYLLEKGADPNKPINNNKKQTPMTYAADRGESVLLQLLIDAGGKHDQKDGFGMTPISYAAREDYKNECVEILIEAGADVNAQEDYGFSPLHEAAENNAVQNIASLLKAGADKSLTLKKAFNPYAVGDTPLDVANKKNNTKAIELLS